MDLRIEVFRPRDQPTVKALILEGLAEHWGHLDAHKNPDLEDIVGSYKDGHFLVGWVDGQLVGCGALLPHSGRAAQIVRMSVAKPFRRRSVGRQILQALIAEAKQRGHRQVVLETTSTWQEVIAFYLQAGFLITHQRDGDTYFVLELGDV